MKALILILLAAGYAAAQSPTIADIARQERAKRAGNTSTRVYTTADIQTNRSADAENPAAPAPPANPVPAVTPAVPGPAAGTATPAVDKEKEKDPVQEWIAQTDKLRQETRLLLDQETATQIEITATMNRVNAPVTNQTEKDRALADLAVSQSRLGVIRDQLTKKRAELQARELEGPPKK